MNKPELIDHVSKLSLQTKAEVEKSLEALTTVISRAIAEGDEVKLIGFGTFGASERKARLGRNPQTGEEIQIPARKVPVFRPGKELKNAVNQQSDKN